MINLYFISGLGADSSVFSRLELQADFRIHYLEWIEPKANESIKSYAKRLSQPISNPAQAVVIGLSFGGIMAIEIAKILKVKQVIIISSVKTKEELPPWLRFIGKVALQHLLPAEKLLEQRELGAKFFGCNTSGQRAMLETLFDRADPAIVEWSIDQLLNWQNDSIPENLYHLHGTADTVFPKAFVSADEWIKNGPHFMVYSHAKAVSKALIGILENDK